MRYYKAMKGSNLFILGILAVLVISGCTQTGQLVNIDNQTIIPSQTIPKCPASCDDNDPCTRDYCDKNTNFQCRHTATSDVPCGEGMACVFGVCERVRDKCSITYDNEDLTKAEAEWEVIQCYQESYLGPARLTGNLSICSDILEEDFMAKCVTQVAIGQDDIEVCETLLTLVQKDQCFFDFANFEAERYEIPDHICVKIADGIMKTKCESLKDVVTAPVGFKEFYVGFSGTNISSYIILKDIKGRTTTGSGNLTIYLVEETKKGEKIALYRKTLEIFDHDFKLTGLSTFGNEDIAYVIRPIDALRDLQKKIEENKGIYYVTLYTTDGKGFFDSEDLDF